MDELIERLDDFIRRLESIGESEMSPAGQTSAVALLTVLNAGLFRDCRTALTTKTDTIERETDDLA